MRSIKCFHSCVSVSVCKVTRSRPNQCYTFRPCLVGCHSGTDAAEPRVGRGTVAVAAVGQALPILMGAHKYIVFTVIYNLLLFGPLGEQYSMNQ